MSTWREDRHSTSYPLLDAHLPDRGWPAAGLTEVLHVGQTSIWQLVSPALRSLLLQEDGRALLVDPPCEPCSAEMAAHGFPWERLCQIRTPAISQRLWACEQALACRDVRAMLVWLPGLELPALRRLQLAASKYRTMVWVFRPEEARYQSSPAVLRLLVREGKGRFRHELEVEILKRRGPPLEQVLRLPTRGERLREVIDRSLAMRARELALPLLKAEVSAPLDRRRSLRLVKP